MDNPNERFGKFAQFITSYAEHKQYSGDLYQKWEFEFPNGRSGWINYITKYDGRVGEDGFGQENLDYVLEFLEKNINSKSKVRRFI